jgi:hypothetical protein
MAFRTGSIIAVGDSASTSRTVTRPAGAASGDILLLRFYVEDQSLTPSLSPGTWTKVTSSSGEVGGGTPFEVHDYWSRQGAESGDITITWGGASVWNTAIAGAWTGRYPTGDPQDGTATFNTSSGTTVTATGLTTAHDDADVIAFGSNAHGGSHSWTGVTEQADLGGQSIGTTVQGVAGGTGSKTATITSGAWAAGLIALRAVDPTPPVTYPDGSVWRRQHSGRLTSFNLTAKTSSDVMALIAANEFFEVPAGGVAYTLTAASGSFAVSGTVATLRAARKLAAAAGAVSVTGTAAGLKAGRKIAAASGAFSLTGTAAALRAARRLPAASGAVAITGTAADLIYTPGAAHYTLTAASGAFAVTGTAASLRAGRKMSAASGSFAVTGMAAALTVGGGAVISAEFLRATFRITRQVTCTAAMTRTVTARQQIIRTVADTFKVERTHRRVSPITRTIEMV